MKNNMLLFHLLVIGCIAGDALPSHRDELLREIKLMKLIGYHTNIVTLVGACTVCDPIALIMEYMPYGNLQTFLQYVHFVYTLCFKQNAPNRIWCVAFRCSDYFFTNGEVIIIRLGDGTKGCGK